MLNNQQKYLIHEYKRAADLCDAEYRLLLDRNAGCTSSAATSFGQREFDLVMAAMETVLFLRVDAGQVPNPIGKSRRIQSAFYWRKRLTPSGMISRRQANRIENLWHELQCHLLPSQRELPYLAGIIQNSTGKTGIGYSALTAQEAAHLIDALTDRLSYAGHHASAHQAGDHGAHRSSPVQQELFV
jgi:hypothetical protein